MLVPQYKLVVNYIPYSGSVIMDTYKDEDLLLSNNLTEITEVDQIPYSLTRTFQLPGTNKNNSFFQHAYDISIEEPYLFATNAKVSCYVDFGGLVVVDGYLQLNKIVMIDQEIVDYYEVTVFGTLNRFAKDLNATFLNDLTSLSRFNHTSSIQNITSSWAGNLFSGSIVYPMADYGTRLTYSPEEGWSGIDSSIGGMTIQDWKPAIRVKEVWDAVFNYTGYTYTSNFLSQSWWDSVYMICNYGLKYPVYPENGVTSSLENFGLMKMAPISGGGTDVTMSNTTTLPLPWYNIQSNPSGAIDSNLYYTASSSPYTNITNLRGNISLTFQLSGSAGNGVPHFDLMINGNATPLQAVNNYMDQVQLYNTPQTKTETFTVAQEFTTVTAVDTGSANAFQFGLRYTAIGGSNIRVVLDPGGTPKSFLEITKTCQAADNRILDVPANMPYGQNGIKLIDFIKGIQRKYNLVIYPDQDNFNNFIVETFNDWYNKGTVLNLNNYVDLNNGMEVIPANSLAVNKLGFGDKLDGDYVSSQFRSRNGREYGKQTYIDTVNDFSSGEYNVVSTFASSPILHIENTGLSGSAGQAALKVDVQETFQGSSVITCSLDGSTYFASRYRLTATLKDSSGVNLTSNPYGDFVIPMTFDRGGTVCSSPGTFDDYFFINFGSTSTYIDYITYEFEVCFGCQLVSITPNCVDINNASIPPLTTLTLTVGSDYPQC
jgi:hypothetical protein